MKNSIPLSLTSDDYPIFDESYREILNQKIIDHYRFSEIGFETIEIFNHYLATRMNEIMPVMNKKYQAQETEFRKDYLKSVRTETRNLTKVEDRDGTLISSSDSDSSTLFSDTPNKVRSDNLDNVAISNASLDDTSVSSNSTSSDDATITDAGTITTEDTTSVSAADLIAYHEYNFYNNIDLEVINSLADLFHMIYSIELERSDYIW